MLHAMFADVLLIRVLGLLNKQESIRQQIRNSGQSLPGPWLWGFPGGSDGKESTCNAGDLGSNPGSEDPLEEGMATTPVFLPGESHGQRSLAATVHGLTKSQTRLNTHTQDLELLAHIQ